MGVLQSSADVQHILPWIGIKRKCIFIGFANTFKIEMGFQSGRVFKVEGVGWVVGNDVAIDSPKREFMAVVWSGLDDAFGIVAVAMFDDGTGAMVGMVNADRELERHFADVGESASL